MQTNIEKNVMRRIFLIRMLRYVFSGFTVGCFVLVVALFGLGREVWVARIFQNTPANLADLPRFYIAAFDHTRLTVQALILLTIASFIYLARAIVRIFSTAFFNSLRVSP
ncbi:hypothetical protein CO131_01915 [Candidatus Kaiserbacteria bacterium CG_4_9_14_3_um_filter_50_16]|uniref:Uncharacterized protein n=1 Tax=Candidatus Kaiserbacteria bacterium CG08_land_8_20_14_0_20_50_21 TaxID=1974604 RepID=A0A2H0YYI9_9BACT|nr:MAG: hypothetical protein AUJ45_00315 [Parcubacteria group bacterium CG1_02_50_68]PIS43561.1 MAG: hypothetical protein COT23_00490 [Candidatus Kaiserbacteria bacterium CG08_land_8_20_14_0_20_50_21]PIU82125.1 MAG: hypothetical protein COS69_00880 [Candidatus Kaiserbacteria bacterium CG06_land_8_20_14_3_00_49_31]PIW96252.1 MAG: hypothetical protein COZ83_01810 [Candidatus Kaiserbacteria bacterium CG_4_8_14_3_um_filter_50_23]PJA01063.1 MAG: hypothetical protein COX76_00420 [Candidatus Kaiserbac